MSSKETFRDEAGAGDPWGLVKSGGIIYNLRQELSRVFEWKQLINGSWREIVKKETFLKQ